MITVLFQTESHFPVKKSVIAEAIETSLKGRVTSPTEVSVTIVGDRRMLELNSHYRQKDHTTDVLSFPQYDPTQPAAPFVDMPDGVLRLGDIVVSYPQAVKEATEENKLVDDKIVELVLHGLEHLLGNHHEE
ncbi:rRNA maturation RNase YbeY [Candidatus Gottesmanbacteria bacterium]|nr:rRNA maturation RNase YbeY [Candidatus Gottesmanbacteria bacterium]